MIPTINWGVEDLQEIATAIALSKCGPRVIWDATGVAHAADAAAAMPPDSISIVIRLAK